MRVIGVLDLVDGRAVHARAGRRERYAPVREVAGMPIEPGDAPALARFYIEQCGLVELYAADLDAIRRAGDPDSPASPSTATVATLAMLDAALWLDAGIASVGRARNACEIGAARVVVGLETLPSFDVLRQICSAVGGDRVVFSLDLRAGEPMVAADGIACGDQPHDLAERAADAGVGAMVVIDVARVGGNGGLDMALVGRLRASAPDVMLLAGGGVRGLDDLRRLAGAGCDGALVATALHSGELSAADVAAARLF